MAIRVLDPETVNKIAAGEVVERPSSVVKELVENSIDAGARRIVIDIEDGGKKMIKVADDGCGMSPEDAQLALKPHATSKISSVEDLWNVQTMGFRGEALPSIAAISKFRLLTSDGTQGTEIRLSAGKDLIVQPSGAPRGTTVWVQDMFYNVPARYKFLKSSSRETQAISDVVARLAAAHPHIYFHLRSGGRTILEAGGTGDLRHVMAQVFGNEFAADAIDLYFSLETVTVSGLLAAPPHGRPSRSGQFFSVNRRPVRSLLLTWVTDDATRGRYMPGKHPVLIVNVSCSEGIDVNVHPTKAEVRFAREDIVRRALFHAYEAAFLPRADYPVPAQAKETDLDEWPQADDTIAQLVMEHPATGQRAFPELRFLAQTHGSYLLAEACDGIYIIDQHAAHERVFYEEVESTTYPSQLLAVPVTVSLDANSAAAFDEHRHTLEELGFDAEPFGPRSVIVRAVPGELAVSFTERVFTDLLEHLVHADSGSGLSALNEARKALAACHASVRASRGLSDMECVALIERLRGCREPFFCPHGRPTFLKISLHRLRKDFLRT